LDPNKPINVYWLDYAVNLQNPPKEDLIWIEKKMAYGYDFEKSKEKEGEYIVTLKALSGKNLRKGRLFLDENNKPISLFPLANGKETRIHKIYVCSQETFGLLPTVSYVDLYAKDPETDEDVIERVTI